MDRTEDENLYIIDAIAPFFTRYQKENVNWSKIPFSGLEKKGHIRKKHFKRITRQFHHFISEIFDLGYNSISIDDLAHLADCQFYPAALRSRIQEYQQYFQELFLIAKKKNLKIFLNTDIMFFNSHIDKTIGTSSKQILNFLEMLLICVFDRFPLDGVIFRIGETDGLDVKGDFLSRLTLKTPYQVNRFIHHLLPLFEQRNKHLIFRTWTVGAYKIGDLMWNPSTFNKAFKNINSKNFFISMKYGDTDFFDHLSLSPFFNDTRLQKLMELQTRRERELFGIVPYYTGFQYKKYQKLIKSNPSFKGISVWCNTGGWSRWKNLSFQKHSSIWNELNTVSTLQLFKRNQTADAALFAFFNNTRKAEFAGRATRLVGSILYIKNFSEQTLYFRRLRIPPLLWLFWDHITINPFISAFHQCFDIPDYEIPYKELNWFRREGKQLGFKNIQFQHNLLLCLDRKSVV